VTAHSGKTAIVTGASFGIGRASAEALAQAGFTVFGTSRRRFHNSGLGRMLRRLVPAGMFDKSLRTQLRLPV
jgi:NAD(P)-dependent dehydrogenase (short-subunit alcohol dehydrogenase family)